MSSVKSDARERHVKGHFNSLFPIRLALGRMAHVRLDKAFKSGKVIRGIKVIYENS